MVSRHAGRDKRRGLLPGLPPNEGSRGVGCIITLGGDSTNRVVAKACGEVPIFPLSTGTNNVFPFTVEATVAGMAAGLVSRKMLDPDETLSHRKRLDILRENEVVDLALIDAVVMKTSHIGARAVWETDEIKQIVQTCGALSDIGFTSIGGDASNTSIVPTGMVSAWRSEMEAGLYWRQSPRVS